ncbi:low affinity iron permease family protein [Flavobacterium sp. J49]|uniref:low affinity iron permease family protein n=1 Tax=Flavobacterium sp. J49 TaxID=2718534 RepID=UPI00159371FD|nr:low affinity iron permease family protein [Flavobacterium sp. J49]MBF6641965.1 low affinity iron permease family protein [Flavobacterium sp. J49]NIC03212.1 low affinity iron permease family protein [Flavobacterium sp. J49]
MNSIYNRTEHYFEKLTSLATKVLGSSITFLFALLLVLFWWTTGLFKGDNFHDNIGDFIFGTTFLCLFIIQKSSNRYSALVHLKMNELISSHETANNAVMDDSTKTEHDILNLSKKYMEQEESIEGIQELLNNPDTDSQNK